MAKVILTCGKLCSGKTTYAQSLRKELNAALLSVDEITLALFGQDAGSMHDEYVARLERYLMAKSIELVEVGVNVVMDWGLWTRAEREEARAFYRAAGVPMEIHCISISNALWATRIARRNQQIREGKVSAYYVDEGLARKVSALFEPPTPDEADVWVDADGARAAGELP